MASRCPEERPMTRLTRWLRTATAVLSMHFIGISLALHTGDWGWVFLPLPLWGQIPSTLTDSYDALLTTTLRAMQPRLHDNISRGNRFLNYLNMRGRWREQDGGERVKVPLMYSMNSTADIYSGYGNLDTTPQDGISSAFYPWARPPAARRADRRQPLAVGAGRQHQRQHAQLLAPPSGRLDRDDVRRLQAGDEQPLQRLRQGRGRLPGSDARGPGRVGAVFQLAPEPGALPGRRQADRRRPRRDERRGRSAEVPRGNVHLGRGRAGRGSLGRGRGRRRHAHHVEHLDDQLGDDRLRRGFGNGLHYHAVYHARGAGRHGRGDPLDGVHRGQQSAQERRAVLDRPHNRELMAGHAQTKGGGGAAPRQSQARSRS